MQCLDKAKRFTTGESPAQKAMLPMQPVVFPNQHHEDFVLAKPPLTVSRLTCPVACLVPPIIGLVKVPQSS